MNGIHDMGGMEGFGPVQPEPNEPPFHSEWEGRALAMNRALGYAKIWNIDKSRAKIEEMPPHEYLTKTYYQKWAQRLEQLLIEYGYIGEDEVKAGRSLRPGKPVPRFLPAAEVNKALSRGSYSREPTRPARFKAGDRVRTKNIHPHTHTGCRAMRATRSASSNACAASTCSRTRSRSARARTRNGSIRCCSTPGSCGAKPPTRSRKSRSKPGTPILSPRDAIDPAAARRATQAVPSIPCDAEGPVFREPWEAQAFAMALALHERGLFTWSEWAATLRTRSSARRRRAIPTPARPITGIGSTRWSGWSPKKARPMRRRWRAIAMPGTTPPTARRTARRSS